MTRTTACHGCGGRLDAVGWCDACSRGGRLRADVWARLLLDDGSAAQLCADLRSDDPLAWPGYGQARSAAAGDEAVQVWQGTIEGQPCVLVVFDFAHLGGSQGAGAGARVSAGFEHARKHRLATVTVMATGGSRMQEGMIALAQMGRTTVAANAHAGAGLLQIAVATDPSTGGVYTSHAGQADLVVAEPGAYVGFAGRRVAASLSAELPQDANSAEFAFAHGLVDALVPRPRLRSWLARALSLARPPATPACPGGRAASASDGAAFPPLAPLEPWAAVQSARDPQRPQARDIVARLSDVVRLRGDRCGSDDPGTLVCLARLDGRPLGVVGLDRHPVQPAGYRLAWRLFDLAARLRLPVLTLIDTPGADPGPAAEAGGQAHAIGQTLARLVALPVPTVGVVIGEGGSGGAMALALTDRLLIQHSAVFSVIAPEGAAAILHRDPARAPAVARQLKLTAQSLVDLGVGDAVIADGVDAVLAAVTRAHDDLVATDDADRLAARAAKWGGVGEAFVERQE